MVVTGGVSELNHKCLEIKLNESVIVTCLCHNNQGSIVQKYLAGVVRAISVYDSSSASSFKQNILLYPLLQQDWLVVFLQNIYVRVVYHFKMLKIDHLSQCAVLFTYTKLSLSIQRRRQILTQDRLIWHPMMDQSLTSTHTQNSFES